VNLNDQTHDPVQSGQDSDRKQAQEAPPKSPPPGGAAETQWNLPVSGDSRLLKPGRPIGQLTVGSTSPAGASPSSGTQLPVNAPQPPHTPSSAPSSAAHPSSVPPQAGAGARRRAPLGSYGVASLGCFGVAAVAAAALLIGVSSGGATPSGGTSNSAPAEVTSGASVGAGSLSSNDDGAAVGAGSAATDGTTAAPTISPEEQALQELGSLRSASLTRLVLDGRWVAQVASKNVGITDPLQVAANGTHTFYAADILAESKAAVSSVPPSSALVLLSTDFGKRSLASNGQPYWVTVVDGDFSSSDEVESWCASTFTTLTPQQLADTCAPRTLAPPHD
jgi:hypothetical protein